MRTEIDKDFRIERHKEYTIIGPFRTYAEEEDKEEKKTEIGESINQINDEASLGQHNYRLRRSN